MKNARSRLTDFLIFGGAVFLLTLFVNGPSRLYPHPFFTPLDDIPRRLPFSLGVGVIVGLIYSLRRGGSS